MMGEWMHGGADFIIIDLSDLSKIYQIFSLLKKNTFPIMQLRS